MKPDQARIEKLRRQAPKIATKAHFERILKSFPETLRDQLRAEITPLLNLKIQ